MSLRIKSSSIWLFTSYLLSIICIGASAKPIEFSIERGDAKHTLVEFAKSAKLSLLVRASYLNNIETNSVIGKYEIETALNLLLNGTTLVGELEGNNKIKILRRRGYLNSDFALESMPLVQTEDTFDIEEVVVSGIRYAMLNSRALKRDSLIVSEVLTEEDIGDMPDDNVADVMRRMNGVQLEDRNGEAARIRIRGLDQNLLLYNGETFLTGMEYFEMGMEQQTYQNSIETVPVELLRRIEVYKSPRASIVEGSQGGTVNFVGRSAFDVRDTLFSIESSVERYSSEDSLDHEVFMGLGKRFGDNFAVLLTADFLERDASLGFRRNYASRALDNNNVFHEELWAAQYLTQEVDGVSVQFIAPEETALGEKNQSRAMQNFSANIGVNLASSTEIEFMWLSMNSEITSESYEAFHRVASSNNSGFFQPIDEMVLTEWQGINFLESGYSSEYLPMLRSIGEHVDSLSNNYKVKMNWQPSDKWKSNIQLVQANATFNQALGHSDLTPLAGEKQLPIWFEEAVYRDPTTRRSKIGPWWTVSGLQCPSCYDFERVESKVKYDIHSSDIARFESPEVLNQKASLFGDLSRAHSQSTEQDKWVIRNDTDFYLESDQTHSLSVGFRIAEHDAQFTKNRFLTDLSRTENSASPAYFDQASQEWLDSNFQPDKKPVVQTVGIQDLVYSDLCGNGGLLEGKSCDLDGDGIDDNTPYGPWRYELDSSQTPLSSALRTSSGYPLSAAFYGTQFNSTTAPGLIPWQYFDDNPGRFTTLNDFYSSIDGSKATFIDAREISANVADWIANQAPNSPTQPFFVPRDSWELRRSNRAFYLEWNNEQVFNLLDINAGLRYVENETTIINYEIDNGEGVSLTNEAWFQSLVGTGYIPKKRTSKNSFVLPSMNTTLRVFDHHIFRIGVGQSIAYPAFQQLAGPQKIYFYSGFETGDFNNIAVAGRIGNPDLEPEIITSIDFSYELYFADVGLFQTSIFRKSIEDKILDQIVSYTINDQSTQGQSEFEAVQPVNSGNFTINGIEFAASMSMRNGWGFSSNYTFLDLEKSNSRSFPFYESLPGVSEESANFSVFFEKTYMSARLAYTWRSEYVSPYLSSFVPTDIPQSVERRSFAQVFESRGQLDAKIASQFTDNLSLELSVINIFNDGYSSYLGFSRNSMSAYEYERRFIASVKFLY